MDPQPVIRRVAPHVVEFAFDARIDPLVHEQALRLADALGQAGLDGIDEIVTGYHSVGVRTRPDATDRYRSRWPAIMASLRPSDRTLPHRTYELPVEFRGDDLADIARYAGMTIPDVVRLFCSAEYRVYMNGFLGGFPYMASVPEPLRVPRRDTPRPLVKAGTVALAGEQAGIYRVDSPGGWNLIGHVRPDADALDLRPGDQVRFREVTA